jgi:hypothetical protein
MRYKEGIVILVRFVCQARFGKAADALAGIRQSGQAIRAVIGPHVRIRLLTDLSGPFDTVVQELEVESLAEWEQLRARVFSNPEVQAAEAAQPDVIVSGQVEYYTIEEAF